MLNQLQAHQLDFVIIASNHNPSILNPDFLYRTGVVKEEWGWELARDPISTPPFSEVNFKSGLSISAQFERLIFTDAGADNLPDRTRLADIATRYIDTLPHVTYTAIGVNPKAYLPAGSERAGYDFVVQRLIKQGPWMRFGGGLQGGSVSLVFMVNEAKLVMSLDVATVRGESCILFQGNFHRGLKDADHDAKLDRLRSIIRNWRNDYEVFIDLVKNHIIGGVEK